ncbi:hypothetical protein [Silvanigrella aquatica]|uniref:Uncharacterized protein n=1 Tax=Silvanigrella aquatica TaxID=1915309 RepID=A0A1L4CZP2_9BACT|nr:hypothetical protein [Silvanigrella aquatica]APJ03408.1 hypothetical protein AXG55_05605 [Silvanigrella aquatica]
MTLNLTAPSKLSKVFMQKSPIRTVASIGMEQYFHADSKSMHPISLTANKSASQSANSINLIELKKFAAKRTYILLTGEENNPLDDKLLMDKKDLILSLTTDSVGLACFEIAKVTKKISAKKFPNANDFIKIIHELSMDTDDVAIMAKPQKIQTLASKGYLEDKISYFPSEKLKTKHRLINIFPIFSPHVFDEEVIIYNINDSFVIADPISYFVTESNQLAVDIHIDIQNKNSVEIFKL